MDSKIGLAEMDQKSIVARLQKQINEMQHKHAESDEKLKAIKDIGKGERLSEATTDPPRGFGSSTPILKPWGA